MSAALTLPFSDLPAAAPAQLERRAAPKRPAAGVLLHLTDHEGDWYLLGKRSKRLGGTWANIGGSLEPDEAPLSGALRELWEEAGVPATTISGSAIRRVVESRMPGTEAIYTLFVLDVNLTVEQVPVDPDPAEMSEAAWWHADAISGLRLHPGFREQWEALR